MPAAADLWSQSLGMWVIPEPILAAAPESPWALPVALFDAPAQPDDTPSRQRALEALAGDGDVIDVGAGGGAASLALVPPARRIVAVDSSAEMLASFASAAERAGVAHIEIAGAWPDVAAAAGVADVVVSHHVLYNVPDLPPFLRALTAAARRRVVVEITALHPRARTNALFERFHGLTRPEHPTAADALAVLDEVGIDARHERFLTPQRVSRMPIDERVAFVRRSVCLTADRDPEIEAAMRETGFDDPREVVAIWWDGTG